MIQGLWSRASAARSYDDVGDLESASLERYGDGWELLGIPKREVGSVYLFGYTIEMVLKCAIYELAGVVPGQNAFSALRSREGLASARSLKIHELPMLAANLRARRLALALVVDPVFEREITDYADRASEEWNVFLRYRHSIGRESDTVRMADLAQWFVQNRRKMVK
jgi:hypothetical protein